MKYWRTMLIASALGICGLAVWANDAIRGDAPKNASTPSLPAATSVQANDAPPAAPVSTTEQSELESPATVPDLAAAQAPQTQPIAPTVVPVSNDEIAPSKPNATPPLRPYDPPPLKPKPLPPEPPPIPLAALNLPDRPAKAAAGADVPKPAPSKPDTTPPIHHGTAIDNGVPVQRDEPPMPLKTTPMPMPPAIPLDPQPSAANPAPSASTNRTEGAYTLHLRLGGATGPRVTVRDGDTLLLKVFCERIDLHATQEGAKALPGLTASGKVRFSGSGLSGTCDQLTLIAVNGEVQLNGNIKMTCYRGDASTEVVAESMSFQLKGSADAPAKRVTATGGTVVHESN